MSDTEQARRMTDGRLLDKAYQEALAFSPNRAKSLAITSDQASEYAEQESAFQTIAVDENGLTGGMRLHLLEPARELVSEWREYWNNFEIAIQPKMGDITAVQKFRDAAEEERTKKEKALKAVEDELLKDPKYDEINEDHRRAKELFDLFRDKHGNRAAMMFARSKIYWLALAFVLSTECFINYHAFNLFWGVPIVALGSALVLGFLLALAAHGHGEVIKQWSFRFGSHRELGERWGTWRMFGLSNAGLLITLAFTGWARWSVALDMMGSESQASALGNIGVVQVNPGRDVIVSLIANLGAWMVGVIISYLSHDADPEYMAATSQFRKARKRWNRARAGHAERLKQIEAKSAKVIDDNTRSAETRQKSVTREMDMLKQVTSRGDAVLSEVEQVITRNAEIYRDALVKVALARKGQVKIVKAGSETQMTPFDYRTMRISPPQFSAQAA